MAKKPCALAGIFDNEPEAAAQVPAIDTAPAAQPAIAPRRSRRSADVPAPAAPARRSSHPGKKPVLIHIPEDMHRALRQLAIRAAILDRLQPLALLKREERPLHDLTLVAERKVAQRRDEQVELGTRIAPLAHGANLAWPRLTRYWRSRRSVMTVSGSPPSSTLAWVRVQAIPDYGMATIWDADILIWAASTLNRMKQQGVNDLPRTLTTTPYDLLRAIKRSTGGRDYQELQAALLRLQTTSITTSIRATKRRQKAGFNWLDSWTFDTDAETEQPRGMTLTLSDWVYEGIVNEKSLLTMHPDYFLLSGGLERALYRIARKHVGTQRGGWLCRVEVLRDKTGSDAQPKEFNRMLRRVIEADQLPDYSIETSETTDKSPAVLFRLRGEAEALTLAEKMRIEDERRARVDADRRHADMVDARMDRLAGCR